MLFALLLSACSVKNYEHTQTKILILKSPKIKFADVAYLKNSAKHIELELFIAGQAVKKIEINHLICIDEGCMSKRGFNEEYLSKQYPDDILQNILLGRAIFDAKNRVQTQDGFEQHIKNIHVDIIYRVSLHVIYFKDRENNILIKIKDTNG